MCSIDNIQHISEKINLLSLIFHDNKALILFDYNLIFALSDINIPRYRCGIYSGYRVFFNLCRLASKSEVLQLLSVSSRSCNILALPVFSVRCIASINASALE